MGHDNLPSYAKGKRHSEKQWRSMMRQLFAAGLYEVGGEYGSLLLTARGRQVLAGGLEVTIRQDSLGATNEPRVKKSATALAEGQVDAKLLSALKAQRLDLAREKKSPAFVIFADRTLIDMAQKKPQSHEDFADIFGVGDKKVEAYADIFIAVIKEYLGSS